MFCCWLGKAIRFRWKRNSKFQENTDKVWTISILEKIIRSNNASRECLLELWRSIMTCQVDWKQILPVVLQRTKNLDIKGNLTDSLIKINTHYWTWIKLLIDWSLTFQFIYQLIRQAYFFATLEMNGWPRSLESPASLAVVSRQSFLKPLAYPEMVGLQKFQCFITILWAHKLVFIKPVNLELIYLIKAS